MVKNILVKIDKEKLSKLRNHFAKNGETSCLAYMVIDNYIRWFEQDPNLKNVNFFCLNGDFSDGTFILTVSCYYKAFVFKYTFV